MKTLKKIFWKKFREGKNNEAMRIRKMIERDELDPNKKFYDIEHDLGCEIQHTGKCNCKDEGYEQSELDKKFLNEDGDTPIEALDKISVKDIPF